MVSWENTDLFLKHDGLPRTNKLAFKTWLINKYIMILHFKSAFCLMHQLLKEIFQFLGKQQERKKSSAKLGLFYKVIVHKLSKYWNVRQKICNRIQWRMTARAVWLQHSASTGFHYDWRGHREAFVGHLLTSTPVLKQTAKDKIQKQMFSHFCTLLSCTLLSGNINPVGIWKNTQGHISAPSLLIGPCTGEGRYEQKETSLQDSQSQT